MFKYPSLKYTDQALTICAECWKVIDWKCCWMALVVLSCKAKRFFRRYEESITRFLGMYHNIYVLNAENRLNVELQFELFDLHMRFWFLSAYSCFKHFTCMTLWWENYSVYILLIVNNYTWYCIRVWNLVFQFAGRREVDGIWEWGDEEIILI